MGINSRSKGNRNERIAAKRVAIWTKREFSRTPSSGGLQWKSTNSKGDIVCTTEGHYFPFCIEIKAHKEIDFSELLRVEKKGVKVMEFWSQCLRDAKKAKKIPLLMMRYDGMPAEFFFVGMTQEHYEGLFIYENSKYKGPIFKYCNDQTKTNLVIFTSTQLFSTPYKIIRKHSKKYRNGKS